MKSIPDATQQEIRSLHARGVPVSSIVDATGVENATVVRILFDTVYARPQMGAALHVR